MVVLETGMCMQGAKMVKVRMFSLVGLKKHYLNTKEVAREGWETALQALGVSYISKDIREWRQDNRGSGGHSKAWFRHQRRQAYCL